MLTARFAGRRLRIRKLIEELRKRSSDRLSLKEAQERVYRFMSVMAGDAPGYEEALRALYRKDRKTFSKKTQTWPKDIRDHAREVAKGVFC